MIPVYSDQNNRLLRWASEDYLFEHAHHFRLVRNRRGHVTRAYYRPLESLDIRPDSKIGLSFEQHLPSGKIWALRGTTGAK